MYDELVKRLREVAGNRDEKCESCPYTEDYPCCVDCLDKLHRDAADAIEKFLSERDEVNADSWKRAFEVERDEHRWIPVEERLPEIGTDVLVCTEDYGKSKLGFVACAEWTGAVWVETWAKKSIVHFVTHWMPLPAPPEVEK